MENVNNSNEEILMLLKLLNGKMDGFQKQLDTKIGELREDMNTKFAEMKSDMDTRFSEVKTEIADFKSFVAELHQETTTQIRRIDRFSRSHETDLDKTILKVEKLSESKSDYNIED
jgi:hypothetical protein